MLSPVLLLGAFVLLIVALIALVIRLARGRDVPGSTPSCGRCGYNLTGAPGNRCPECGQLFIEAGVTFMSRERSRRSIVTGVTAFALVGLVVLAGLFAMRTFNAGRARAAQAQATAARNAAVRQKRQVVQALQAQGANLPAGTVAPQAERSSPGDAGDNVGDSEPGDAPASRPSS